MNYYNNNTITMLIKLLQFYRDLDQIKENKKGSCTKHYIFIIMEKAEFCHLFFIEFE